MKYLLSLLLAAALLVSCQSPVDNAVTSTTSPGMGSLSVRFPSSSRAVDFDYAKANSNYFEVVAYDATNAYYGHITDLAQTVSIALPAGTYNVVALAGNKMGSGSPTYLLGSGSSSGVVITTGATTNASITLTNITFHLTAPVNAQTQGTPFTFYACGDLGTARLGLQLPGYPVFSRSNSTGLNAITVVKDAAKTGSSWGATYTVPTSAQSGIEEFIMSSSNSIFLVDSTMGRSISIQTLSGSNWFLPSMTKFSGTYLFNNFSTTDTSIINQFSFTVNWAIPAGSSTGGFNLGWGTANPN